MSALDKAVEVQVLNLMLDLKLGFGLAYMFNFHCVDIVCFIANWMMVICLSKVA